ncbi:4ed5c420-07e1-45e9-9bef-76229451d857 [Thermothielavioides terrestris]|uniref:4ed5c420-07e1-45e9-9bef-76229451d857 n=1 Tax=Thermothielavioides terrestris TaxID=2587410 RepID=A0A3S4ASA0_9PEZI|nr:4ed5c420-07e1-45e9-9bef-76229451d857 [Thermothielavioides terrestris]
MSSCYLPSLVPMSTAHSLMPVTFPPSVPSSGGLSWPPVAAISLSYSSGVWHFALHAWICAISSLSAAFTSRCLLSEFLPANSGETTSEVNDWPQPPVWFKVVAC